MHRTQALVVVVAGPTASGKTALAIEMAERLRGEIVNFDSVQLYRDFDVGSAKPSRSELARIRHHLIGAANAHSPWTAGEYARQSRPVIEEILGRGRAVVLVGGTGFYLRALIEGLSPAPPSDAGLRRRLQSRSPEQVHRILQRLDPVAGARISVRDRSKAIRALEVRLLSGQTIGAAWQQPPQPWRWGPALNLVLAPERPELYTRIQSRAEAMFAGPIQEEACRLLPDYPADLRIWSSHGYKQAVDIVLHGADPGAALAEAVLEQRHYAKRQLTWFRAQAGVRWLAGFGDDPEIQHQAWQLVQAWAAGMKLSAAELMQ